MPLKQKHKNHLTLIRKKNALEQKQIAVLLGHKTTDQISRYERGVKLPSLKTALKLETIYHLPMRFLFYGYYEICLDQIRKSRKNSNTGENRLDSIEDGAGKNTEFCTITEKLKPQKVAGSDLDKARSHIADLIRTRGEKMNHFKRR